jgi:hypothetical protein
MLGKANEGAHDEHSPNIWASTEAKNDMSLFLISADSEKCQNILR